MDKKVITLIKKHKPLGKVVKILRIEKKIIKIIKKITKIEKQNIVLIQNRQVQTSTQISHNLIQDRQVQTSSQVSHKQDKIRLLKVF